ncbi:flagellar hook-basal body complex protein FliE [Actinokineospora auranticolor]|uniref:Flagellar hook-basal body complex protein FliE n=1 Tax=Actinokineospora auranticolor TaxID=155976 RepID=A0A2S6GMT4_9PSEU|nr:flagellar hook-basal body complex protein FliE [Actinokineospora auranticolor]PPK66476.1 flagellar hook-basal body complex protein FliE [Actinokineospora auranticolor]
MTSPISAVTSAIAPPAVAEPIAIGDTSAATSASGLSFGSIIGSALENTEKVQDRASQLAIKAATGNEIDVHNYLAAATEANLTTQLTVQVRNKAIEAFNEIMRLQG